MKVFRAFLLLLMVFVAVGCGRHATAPKSKAAPLPPVVATASVDRALITTEDPVTFTVTVDRDPTVQVTTPDIGSLIQGFRVTDFGGDEKDEGKRKILKKWFALRADAAGSYILPEIQIRFNQAGKEEVRKTSEVFVEVKAPSAPSGESSGDIRDIKGIEKTPVRYVPIIIAAVLACVGIVAWLYIRRKKDRTTPASKALPPHEMALQQLLSLEFPRPGDPIALKRFYFALSEIARSYVEGRYGFRATDMTFEEIIRHLRSNAALPDSEKPAFIELLKETDLVKFTDFAPTESVNSAAKDRVIAFVNRTKPVVQEAEAVI